MERMVTPPGIPYWQQLRRPLELELVRGCPDTTIVGASIGTYARQWAERIGPAPEEDTRLALSLARGLRDYATMSLPERKRRAMAAIDLLQQREVATAPSKRAPRKPAATRSATSKAPRAEPALPKGEALLDLAVERLAPRAKWPRLLANKLGVTTVRDLLYHIPRDWVEVQEIGAVVDGAHAGMVGTVRWRQVDRLKNARSAYPLYKYTLGIADGTGEAWVVSIAIDQERARGGGGQGASWSPAKLPFREGQQVFALGKVERTGKLIQVQCEDIFEVKRAEAATLRPGTKVPLYPLTNGVYPSQVYRAVMRVLAALGTGDGAQALVDPLPEEIRRQFGLLPLLEALQELHCPRNPLLHEQARKRLAFEEFLTPQLVLARRRWEQHTHAETAPFGAPETTADLVARMVPFSPTAAQSRVLGEIEADLRSPRPMNRLLQGDVGSGKTLVAAGALALAARSGMQGAIMAPTEILAEQLYLVLSRLLSPLGIRPVLLTGTVGGEERRAALASLASGETPIAVGTHALIQEGVDFHALGLVVVDEQHRFGVLQRATLRGKGQMPNTLVMTATPIPRTLALTAYGDLELSVLDELPPGRHPIESRWVATPDLPDVYDFVRQEIGQGRQAYIVCPLVEQSDLLQADAAVEVAEELQRQVFPDLRVGLLHGRMRPEEKDAAMEAFREGHTQILACTTVVEVGVDVPNATVMLIQNAERFGLAQLHQLRGRVGRSRHQSYCYFVTHPRFNPDLTTGEELPARKRLQTMLREQNGFAIAEADLELRGPGEFLGTRQSGVFEYRIGSLVRDGKYLEQARQAAQAITSQDAELQWPCHAELRRRVQRLKARVDQFRE